MNKSTIIAIILGLLVLVSVVQAVQLSSIKSKLVDGGKLISQSSGTLTTVASGSTGKKTSDLPASVKELPQMVGGC